MSLDARSQEQFWPLPLGQARKFGGPSHGLIAHLGVPVGERVRRLRGVKACLAERFLAPLECLGLRK